MQTGKQTASEHVVETASLVTNTAHVITQHEEIKKVGRSVIIL